MTTGRRIKLGIVFGGKSGEHEVSLTSAASVISALNPEKFEVIAIGITKEGEIADASQLSSMLPARLFTSVKAHHSLESTGSRMKAVSSSSKSTVDSDNIPEIIFPLLHGPYGEDGTIQGFLELAGIPYIGSGVLGSAASMDKDIAKKLFLYDGLPVTPWKTVFSRDLVHDKDLKMLQQSLEAEFSYPMFSKPANLGSSLGVVKIHSEKEFEEGIMFSAQFDRKIIIEKGIKGREFECAILGNDDPKASVVGEVFSAHEFYDYNAKYINAASTVAIPAKIAALKADEIRDLAKKAFNAVDGAGLSRVDFFLEHETEKVWINEINTIPGFTPISMYTKLWAESGVPFEELVLRLIQLGEERFRERKERRISG